MLRSILRWNNIEWDDMKQAAWGSGKGRYNYSSWKELGSYLDRKEQKVTALTLTNGISIDKHHCRNGLDGPNSLCMLNKPSLYSLWDSGTNGCTTIVSNRKLCLPWDWNAVPSPVHLKQNNDKQPVALGWADPGWGQSSSNIEKYVNKSIKSGRGWEGTMQYKLTKDTHVKIQT